MRAVLQRVLNASVSVDGKQVSSINNGICVLIGIAVTDTQKDLEHMVKKILNVRVFNDENDRPWTKSVKDLDLEILCVSQFTLYGKTTKGSKPDFHDSMKSDTSRAFYEEFLKKLGAAYNPSKIQDGVFGAHMVVSIANDGPVTLELDSRKFDYKEPVPQGKEKLKRMGKKEISTPSDSDAVMTSSSEL
ncbi:D-tyrosyl-tRNA deacylase [Basidiobolus meristosporus CBS 931.73]|uniref:D-aminoacyl-tRNA deacylase n=1 Tax=Basidiobolus meristosporus CBS 931.73 TaxID=1314790 RepID=A0A1Y1YDN2_9FUNG|nr:D-tyrosyl-tRNA deacylase [Basidiobolus meristosporus CBS 931.73]|eukprot:ORX96130.1 D-tyrosyl-tRNA deacylase [Basidiobolus meristosporus CBS 931.73]